MRKLLILLILSLILSIVVQGFTINESEEHLKEKKLNLKTQQINQQLVTKNDAAKRLLQTVPVTTGTGITNTQTSITQYTNLILYQAIPTDFVIGEIYHLKGKLASVNTAASTQVYCNFVNKLTPSTNYTFFLNVPKGQVQFILKIDTRGMVTGQYYIRLWGGTGGSIWTSTVFNFLGSQPAKTISSFFATPAAPTNFVRTFKDNKLFLSWTQDNKTPIQKIRFVQGTLAVEYILTNFASSFEVPFADFSKFSEDVAVTVSISSAYSRVYSFSGRNSNYSLTASLSFMAGKHHFSEIDSFTPSVTIPQIVSVNTVINIQGVSTKTLSNQYFAQEPGFVVSKSLINPSLTATSTISANTAINFNFKPTKSGAYILQVNADTGSAVLNRPIYVYGTNKLPLIPDFVDLKLNIYLTTGALQAIINAQQTNITKQRASLLSLVNKKRYDWGRPALSEGVLLTAMAQNHSSNLVASNLMGHVDQYGKGMVTRASDFKITATSIGQNVAMNLILQEAHYRLCRSPGHLANIVSDKFQLVGFGVVRNSNGYFILTEQFSSSPEQVTTTTTTTTTTTNTSDIRNQIINWIKTTYPIVVNVNTALSAAIDEWFAIPQPRPTTLINYLANNKGYTSISVSGLNMSPYSSNLVSYLVSPYLQQVTGGTFKTVGVGLLPAANQASVMIYAAYIP